MVLWSHDCLRERLRRFTLHNEDCSEVAVSELRVKHIAMKSVFVSRPIIGQKPDSLHGKEDSEEASENILVMGLDHPKATTDHDSLRTESNQDEIAILLEHAEV